MALGILCLETYWSEDVADRRSVAGLLKLLEDNVEDLLADHRHVVDRRDLSAYIEGAWRWDRYDVLYIAAHGSEGRIWDEDDNPISVRWLASELAGMCRGRVVFLAGCSTANLGEKARGAFLDETGAAALVGYEKDVDWLEAAQMDLLTLASLADQAPDSRGVWPLPPELILRALREYHEPFVGHLGWVYSSGPYWNEPRRTFPDGLEDSAEGLLAIATDASLPSGLRRHSIRALGGIRYWDQRLSRIARDSLDDVMVRVAAAESVARIDNRKSREAASRLRSTLAKRGHDGDSRVVRALSR